MGIKHFIISIALAIFIHFTLIFTYFYQSQNDEGAMAQGEDGLMVGVGITGSYTDNTQEVENDNNIETTKEEIKTEEQQEIEPEPELETMPETQTIPEPKLEVEPKPEIETIPEPKPELKPKQKAEPKVEPKLEPTQETKPEAKSEPTIEPESEIKDETKKEVKESSVKSQAARKATGTGNQEHSGGNTGAKQGYLSTLKARISRAKKYPRSARKEGVVGTVTVNFLVKLNGKVKKIKLIKSSGDERLDKEAIKMLKRASPFPPIPSDVSKEPLNLTLPIEFSLKTIKNKFY